MDRSEHSDLIRASAHVNLEKRKHPVNMEKTWTFLEGFYVKEEITLKTAASGKKRILVTSCRFKKNLKKLEYP